MALPGFLMFETDPLGGPQINFSRTACASFGALEINFSSILIPVIGPNPAGESPRRLRRLFEILNFSFSL